MFVSPPSKWRRNTITVVDCYFLSFFFVYSPRTNRRAVIEVFDASCDKTGVGGEYCAVDDALGGMGDVALRRGVTRAIKAVSANRESDAVNLGFFASEGGNFSATGYFLAGWDLVVGDE